MRRLIDLIKDKRFITLIVILGVGAYLRLWDLEHLFNAVHDYDEGVYILGARFMSDGYLPYRDFTLVHPPLYSLVLTAIFKVLGYNYFLAKYFSVFISLASIILVYFAGKKITNASVGLVAAALFAVSPDMIYFGRRAVQESLGVFLILLAIYFLFSFLSNKKSNRILLCGAALGLAIATKYIFAPALIAIFVVMILILMGERFYGSVKRLARPLFLLSYIAYAVCFMAILFILTWSLKLSIPVPFFTTAKMSTATVITSLVVFVLPLIASIFTIEKGIRYREWWTRFGQVIKQKEVWYLILGSVSGYIVVTAFFWIKMPQEFLTQTVLMQERSNIYFPSIVSMLQGVFFLSSYYGRLAYLPVLMSLPLALILLNKRIITSGIFFLSAAIIIALAFCQVFPSMPRYSISVYPFFLLGLASVVPDIKDIHVELKSLSKNVKAGLLVIISMILLFISLSAMLLTNYGGYDINSPVFASNEEKVYRQTIDYLESVSPKKIFAANPVYAAMSPNLQSSINFDPYASLWLKKESPEKIIQDKLAEGVDYVVLDAWVRWWKDPLVDRLVASVRSSGRLVQVIAPDSMNRTEIYMITAEKQNIFNGDFSQWVKGENTMVPLGWQPYLWPVNSDSASISESTMEGVHCLKLTAAKDDIEDSTDTSYAAISQTAGFPKSDLIVDVLPTSSTDTSFSSVKSTGIHFVDGDHALIFSFSNLIDKEQVLEFSAGSIIVIRPVKLDQWSHQEIDLHYYWDQTKWEKPEKISIYLINSLEANDQTTKDFFIANIKEK